MDGRHSSENRTRLTGQPVTHMASDLWFYLRRISTGDNFRATAVVGWRLETLVDAGASWSDSDETEALMLDVVAEILLVQRG